jgi:hypothetical protein
MFRIQMLHQDKGQPRVGREVRHQFGERFHSARRSPDRHNGSVLLLPARHRDRLFRSLETFAFSPRLWLHDHPSAITAAFLSQPEIPKPSSPNQSAERLMPLPTASAGTPSARDSSPISNLRQHPAH